MKKILCPVLAFLLIVPLLTVQAEQAPVQIYTVEDLLTMAQNPSGDYILMSDLDMSGVTWHCPDFSGTFDGNGHAILNLTLTEMGDTQFLCYDGNTVSYSASYCGLFASISGATVKNLSLLNVRSVLEADCPVFLAGIAGYMEDSTVSDCTVTGCLELRAHNRMFGVGGIAGCGWGAIADCTVDMTLICVDTDSKSRDEQFLGGAYGTGFISVDRCDITLDGYISEHGYVHSGGVVGMYISYPFGIGKQAWIHDSKVTGKITFFEDNTNRRAYCKDLIGETLCSYASLSWNETDFFRDERYDYTVELRPEECDDPVYEETVIDSGCDSYGYTLYTCQGCGYSYKDHYTLFSHDVVYVETIPATEESEGLMVGTCQGCGMEFTQTIPMLEPVPTTEPTAPETVPETTDAVQPDSGESKAEWVRPAVAGAVIAAAVLIVCLRSGKKRGKYQK